MEGVEEEGNVTDRLNNLVSWLPAVFFWFRGVQKILKAEDDTLRIRFRTSTGYQVHFKHPPKPPMLGVNVLLSR